MDLPRLIYATLRMRSSLRCLRLDYRRLDGAYRRELKRAMLKMVLSLLQPSQIFIFAFCTLVPTFSPQPSSCHVKRSHYGPWPSLACSLIPVLGDQLGIDTFNQGLQSRKHHDKFVCGSIHFAASSGEPFHYSQPDSIAVVNCSNKVSVSTNFRYQGPMKTPASKIRHNYPGSWI